jgi:hypothetical protein
MVELKAGGEPDAVLVEPDRFVSTAKLLQQHRHLNQFVGVVAFHFEGLLVTGARQKIFSASTA